MSEHTTGPWYVDDGSSEHFITIHRAWDKDVRPENDAGAGMGDYRGVLIATLEHQNDNPIVPKSRALSNAILISAAPELLTALEHALQIIGHPDDAGSKYIASVIAKAKGE